ncbi:hypothetical protein L596_016861 [Steinernema carpocapsae]|uniref:Peptidase C1A papain C-terminal domain-containing protein n=1 Tax=Steinernema carpocapsae TaxID=34508 RepID=A0A4U5NJB3_STECR|nr:hypothetical protein L596_016861 [Steinernema carpocapsae]
MKKSGDVCRKTDSWYRFLHFFIAAKRRSVTSDWVKMKSESVQSLIAEEQLHLWDSFFDRTYLIIRRLVIGLAILSGCLAGLSALLFYITVYRPVHDNVVNDESGSISDYYYYLQRFSEKVPNLTNFQARLRHNVFRQNSQFIAELNTLSETTEFEENEFTDWTEEEIKQMLLPEDYYRNLRANAKFIKPASERTSKSLKKAASGVIPDAFDWREKGVVTPVKAQGKCGSCWAFATAATVESNYAIAYKDLRNLTEQELLDCNLENNACNGGDMDKSFEYVRHNGLMLEEGYPYVGHRQNTCMLEGNTTKIQYAYFINPDEQSMIDWLLEFGPVNIGISVTRDMLAYKSGVFHPSDYDCKNKVLGLHALLVTGYNATADGTKYWIVKNSWGQKWGTENGYVNFIRGVNACGIEQEPIGVVA